MSAGQITQGRRVYPDAEGKLHFSEPGDYGKLPSGQWRIRLPRWTNEVLNEWTRTEGCKEFSVILGPPESKNHTVTEHEDGTISASPSILWGADYGMGERGAWHGYLERGVWREV